ncbi:hypothetical protein H2200_007769 [Cladophialophora chaetospira]|uniref:Uncharacterized protein n=1 Tax=Cladophialophora chaetospira TaxID=386627 RepID=A0AA39CGE2_9EURO|nr:hypothetical protein H2200_007769 [Cladophialophora chaetospira]
MASPDSMKSPTKIPFLDEKGLNTPASRSSDSPPPTPGRDASKNKIEGGLSSILWGAFGPCIPVVAVTSILLTIVLHNRIPKEYVFLPAQQTKLSNQDSSALHGLEQIDSNVMPFILGASMTLVGFFAGQRIIDNTRKKSEALPTPRQMSLLIGLIDASGLMVLWDTMTYRRHSKETVFGPLRLAFWSLCFIIFMTFVIGAADSCMTNWTVDGQQREGLYHAQQAAETLMTNSLYNIILNFTDKTGANFFFLGDPQGSAELDFAAKALAVKTECRVRTNNCTVHPTGGFTCGTYTSPSFSFSGQVGVDAANATSKEDEATAGIQFFKDAALTQAIGVGSDSRDLFSAQNPVHFLSWSKGFPPVDTYADEFAYMRSNGYLKNDTNGDAVFILSCSSTIYQAEYLWVNGSVSPHQLATYEIAPDYYGAVYSAPFATNSVLSRLALQDAAALAAYQFHPESMSNVFADYFSRAAVAFSSGISVPVANDREWSRDNSYLATRVPTVPLYTLIAFKAVYALFALALAVLAVFKTQPSRAQEINARLTVDGLAAGFFEPTSNHEAPVKDINELFQEHNGEDARKIGLLQTAQGSWLWVTVGRKDLQGLGIQETIQPVADLATPTTPHSPRRDLGDRYTLVKDAE